MAHPTAEDKAAAPLTTVAALDSSLRLTPLHRWVTALFLVLIVVAVGLWAVFGKAPVTATGNGAMLPPTGFYQVAAPTSGTVTAFPAPAGTIVDGGQTG